MTHDDAIATLLAAAPGAPPGSAPEGSAARDAQDHVARCSDCFEIVALLHELASGRKLAERAHMQALFGCEPARARFHRVVGLDAGTLARREPELARHLGWCLSCRERFGEVLVVERLAARGEIEPLLAPVRAEWRDAVRAGGEAVRELAGRLAVRVGHAVAAFTDVPAGCVALTAPAPVGLRRAAPVGDPGLAQRVTVPLADGDRQLDLTLQPQGSTRVALVVAVADAAGLVIELRADAGELLARSTLRGDEPVVVRDLAAGRYTLEIVRKQPALRCVLRLDVKSAG